MSTEPTTSFSASGEDAIRRTIEIQDADLSAAAFEFGEFYEIERTAQELVNGGYRRIALQFPDELLHDSVPIFRHLTRRVAEIRLSRKSDASISPSTAEDCANPDPKVDQGATDSIEDRAPELYVLADTSYGSCCVDEVAAQHVSADALVHYGHACMTLTSRLPVIYVFGRKKLDVEHSIAELLRVYGSSPTDDASATKAILLKHDVAYAHVADALLDALRAELTKRNSSIAVLYEKIGTSSRPAQDAIPTGAQDGGDDVRLEHTTIFHVGGESLGLTNLLMTNSGCDLYTYDPRVGQAVLASARTNKLLMRRYVAVQKARDADVFGILVGTLGVASYLPLISHLRQLFAKRQKKSYTISVGKLNPAKLANFLEIECFVLVACPENSLVDDKEFLRPIVTPYELEVAMQAEQSWTGRYVLDFGRLLADAKQSPDTATAPTSTENGKNASSGPGEPASDSEGKSDSDPDQPVFSLLTGKYRHAKKYGQAAAEPDDERLVEGSSAVVLRNQDDQVALMDSAAGQFLQQRTYQGLEMRLGEDAPSVLEQGRSGIARGYQDDRVHQDIS